MIYKSNKAGFTLIELLVVVGIITLLFSIILANLSDSQAQARDVTRINDMKNLENALYLFYNDHGYFPCENASACPGQSVDANGKIGEGSGLDTLLDPYMVKIPVDPLGPGDSTYFYYYDGNHCNDSDKVDGLTVALLSFNKAESDSNVKQDVTCGSEGNQDQADQNIIIGASDG